MPIAVGNGSRVAQVSGNRRTTLEEPAPYALVGNIQTPLRKKILHIPIAQSEPGIEPNGASNDVRWKAVTFEGDGVHPKRLHRNHQIEIRALNVTMPVRDAYNHAVRNGVIRVGWFPAWIKTRNSKIQRKAWVHNTTEACAVSDLLVLAVKLTDAGLGDYWDDVDAVIRNQLTAQQCINLDLMRRISGHGSENDGSWSVILVGLATPGPPLLDQRFWVVVRQMGQSVSTTPGIQLRDLTEGLPPSIFSLTVLHLG